LLKDKDNEEIENFSHFYKFFSDGVPINENIMAMKNLYSFTQKNLETTAKKLFELNDRQKKQNEYLKRDIDQFDKQIKETSLVIKDKEVKYIEEFERLQ